MLALLLNPPSGWIFLQRPRRVAQYAFAVAAAATRPSSKELGLLPTTNDTFSLLSSSTSSTWACFQNLLHRSL